MITCPADAEYVDVHYHAGPDLYRRRYTAAQAGRVHSEAGGWVVLKSHLTSTAAQAWEARQEGLPVSGSVVLNELSGGVRTSVVEQAVYAHGPEPPARLIVYLPTLTRSAPGHHSPHHSPGRKLFHPAVETERWSSPGMLDDDGDLSSEVREVMRSARDLPVVLATGHCNRQETLRVIEEAERLRPAPPLMLTHATHPMSGLRARDLADLATLRWIYPETTALTYLLRRRELDELASVTSAHPGTVYSSDLGQPEQLDVRPWLERTARWFRVTAVDTALARRITQGNPAEMLSLE
ncbi:hypothetical protein SAMN04487904_107142 [Actinopolyspora lacussalsi subsp. righensis]|uniref:Amidohydrolase n=1 Tax=Actinopolyspora righensis TaxID=995060 RepID=A0A1I7AK27_9ACTN|nr:DUF6282 family protein [Actinopolyspora righensis]SFT75288.1 hypothetical protein SAMN04487904_107142 [Actinopolyspora righensis]